MVTRSRHTLRFIKGVERLTLGSKAPVAHKISSKDLLAMPLKSPCACSAVTSTISDAVD